jgi:hypothetical protein
VVDGDDDEEAETEDRCGVESLLRNHVLWLRFAEMDNHAAFDEFRLM